MEIMCLPILNVGLSGDGRIDTPPILNDGNTVAWFDANESYVIKDGSDFVSQMTDRSGNDNHLLQATPTNRPLWSADGVLFNGTDNFMKTAPFTLVRPEFIYFVFKQVAWTNGDYMFDGNIANTGVLAQAPSSPDLRLYAGVALDGATFTLNTFGIARILFNGAPSKIQINESAEVNGDTGTGNMGGFTLGSSGAGLAQYSNIEVKEVIIRNIADTTPNQQLIYDYLKARHSL